MKKTRIKVTDNEMLSIIIGSDNELMFIDIIDKEDVQALDAEYMEEFKEDQGINPFLVNKEVFGQIIKMGMIPYMHSFIENHYGINLDGVAEMSDEERADEIDRRIQAKITFTKQDDNSIN